MSTGTHPIKISDSGPKNQIPKREQRSGIKDDIPEIGSTAPIPLQILATEVARGNREVARQPVARHILPWERADWVENVRSWMIERLEEECNAKCSASSIVPEMLVGGVRMRAKTSKGDFMAVAYPGSGGGAAKIGVLGRVVPRYIFKVVCMSENKEAVLMRDHLDPFHYKVSVKEMEAATKDYVWMQMGTIGRTSELVEGGLMDLRSEVLLRKLDNLEQSLMFREMAPETRSGVAGVLSTLYSLLG
ncbi:unnamed protein product [Chondrus crispus]|uniref:Uncharacterized protein n=1 Tax=Chondrus crispus TaxID=2769 RepID=R7QI54_CHOCR|nr:unnamed protein product [Chondrus crispus]CDF38197.1 unnamed protein product [Chondrus crispus]|eukprot:XP_005718066.1 unnamed protein product [Chondrus crispus]